MAEVFTPGSSLAAICRVARRDASTARGAKAKDQWISSSTRASSTSPGSASRSRRAAWPTPSTRPSPQADAAGYPVVVKAQVQGRRPGQGRRHQAGQRRRRGPRCTPGTSSAWTSRATWCKRLWVEHASDIAEEYYASFTLDRSRQEAPLHAVGRGRRGDRGGRGRPTPTPSPSSTSTRSTGSRLEAARACVAEADARPGRHASGAAELLVKLYRCYVEGDCDLAEINPLILTPEGEVHALDAKVTLDDNAAFRHPEWEEFAATEELDEREQLAKEKGLQYIGLDGHRRHHRQRRRAGHEHARRGQPGRRHGGQLPRHRRRRQRRRHGGRARGHQLRRQASRSIFVNIFGGITRGDEVAKGIVEALTAGRAARPDRAAPRRHQRRGGRRDPGRRRHPGPRLIAEPTMLDAARAGRRPRERLRRLT